MVTGTRNGRTQLAGWMIGVAVAVLATAILAGPMAAPASANTDVIFTRSTDGGQTFGAPQNITNSLAHRTAKVTAENGVVHIVYDNTLQPSEIRYQRSTDGGFTFGPQINLSNNNGDSSEGDAEASNGVLHVTWEEDVLDANGNPDPLFPGDEAQYARSSDAGLTFGPSVPASNTPGSHSRDPDIDADGNLVGIVHEDFHGTGLGGNDEIYFERSTDGGVTWSPFVNVSNDPGQSAEPAIAINGQNVYVVWEDRDDGRIGFNKSTDGGVTWGTPTVLPAGADDAGIIAVVGTTLHVASCGGDNPQYYRSIDNGTTWTGPVALAVNAGKCKKPAIAADGANVYFAWTDSSTGGGDVYLRRSPNGGTSWQTLVNVSSDPAESDEVDLAVDLSTGTVYVIWTSLAPPTAPPITNFTAAPTSGGAPLTVLFSDTSTGGTTAWAWDFENDGIVDSTLKNPTHTYLSPGTYTVRHTSSNGAGTDEEIKLDFITVTGAPGPPAANFSGTPTSGSTPLLVNFTDTSTGGATSWAWDFNGDSITDSTLQNPSFTYTTPGTYTVSLTATNAIGSNTATKVSYISVTVPPPVANFSGTPTSGSTPLLVNFTDTSTGGATSWAWDFDGNGITDSTLQNPSHTYTAAGTYAVSLTAANGGGGDTMTKVGYVTVSGPAGSPIANFTGTPLGGSAPLLVSFTDTSTGGIPTSWSWSFGDGGTSTLQNPTHTYTAAGTYTVSMTATNANGSSTETKLGYVTVSAAPSPPVANFSGTPTSGNAPLLVNFTDLSTGNPTSWLWSFGDGGTSTLQNPSHTYTAAGSYSVSLTATNANGSTTESKITYVTVTPAGSPQAEFSATPLSGVQPLLVDFTDLSTGNPTSWLWSFGDGNTSTLQNPTHAYFDPTQSGGAAALYTVSLTVTNANGSSTETKVGYVSVGTTAGAPVANFVGGPTSGPAALEVAFSDFSTGSPTSWSWSFGDGGTSTERNPEYEYLTPGVYTVSLTVLNANGSSTATRVDYVNVGPALPDPPKVKFSADPEEGVAPLRVKFTDESRGKPTSWLWDFGDGGTTTDQNPIHVYTEPGTYTVSLTATKATGSATETKVDFIVVEDPEDEPGTFAPPALAEKIAFQSARKGNYEIFVMNPDGSGLKRLTKAKGFDGDPEVSPDGSQIVYVRGKGRSAEIWVMNADGSDKTRLTKNRRSDIQPSWSPDGKKIIFASNRSGNYEIYTMNANGKGLKRLTKNRAADLFPSFSPDGKKIAFTRELAGNVEIYTMNANGKGLKRLTRHAAEDAMPVWRPNGKRIAFVSERHGNLEIYSMRATDGKKIRRLTRSAGIDTNPSWSPNGKEIAFESNRTGNFEIYVMTANGKNQEKVTQARAQDSYPAWALVAA